MKFATSKPNLTAIAQQVNQDVTLQDIFRAQEELQEAYIKLQDAQICMMEANVVMDNINISCALIKKCGASAVETLNLDGSLEQLLQIDSKLITAEKSLEGLDDAAKKTWLLLKEWFFRALSAILRIVALALKFYGWVHGMWSAILTSAGNLINEIDDSTFLAVAARARFERHAMEGNGTAEYLLAHPIISIKLMDQSDGYLKLLDSTVRTLLSDLSPDKVKARIAETGEMGIIGTITDTRNVLKSFSEDLSDWLEEISEDMESQVSAKDKGYTNKNLIIKTIKDCEKRSETASRIATTLNNFCLNADKQKEAMINGLVRDDSEEFYRKRNAIVEWANMFSTVTKANQRMAKAISAMYGTCRGGLIDLAKLASDGIPNE